MVEDKRNVRQVIIKGEDPLDDFKEDISEEIIMKEEEESFYQSLVQDCLEVNIVTPENYICSKNRAGTDTTQDFELRFRIGERRQRKKNFSDAEIKILVEEIKKYKNILFNKLSRPAPLSKKNSIWQKITERINTVSACERTVEEVKVKWKLYKKTTKKALMMERQNMGQIGGVLSPIQIDEDMIALIEKNEVKDISGSGNELEMTESEDSRSQNISSSALDPSPNLLSICETVYDVPESQKVSEPTINNTLTICRTDQTTQTNFSNGQNDKEIEEIKSVLDVNKELLQTTRDIRQELFNLNKNLERIATAMEKK